MTRLTFARERDGTLNPGETRLSALVDQLFDNDSEPRVPVSLMNAATREPVAAVHKVAGARDLDFSKAAFLLHPWRPERNLGTHLGMANC